MEVTLINAWLNLEFEMDVLLFHRNSQNHLIHTNLFKSKYAKIHLNRENIRVLLAVGAVEMHKQGDDNG